MSAAFQTEAIADAVNDAIKKHFHTVDSLFFEETQKERTGLHAGAMRAAAMIHAAAIQALATVEAAEIQAAALDRLAIAIRSKRGD